MLELTLVENFNKFYEDHKDFISDAYYREVSSYTNDRPLDINIDLWQKLVEEEFTLWFEVRSEETFIGYINVSLSPSLINKSETEACVEHIVLDTNSRGKGLGKELLRDIENFLIEEGIDELKLSLPSTEEHDAFASNAGYKKALTTHIKRLK